MVLPEPLVFLAAFFFCTHLSHYLLPPSSVFFCFQPLCAASQQSLFWACFYFKNFQFHSPPHSILSVSFDAASATSPDSIHLAAFFTLINKWNCAFYIYIVTFHSYCSWYVIYYPRRFNFVAPIAAFFHCGTKRWLKYTYFGYCAQIDFI